MVLRVHDVGTLYCARQVFIVRTNSMISTYVPPNPSKSRHTSCSRPRRLPALCITVSDPLFSDRQAPQQATSSSQEQNKAGQSHQRAWHSEPGSSAAARAARARRTRAAARARAAKARTAGAAGAGATGAGLLFVFFIIRITAAGARRATGCPRRRRSAGRGGLVVVAARGGGAAGSARAGARAGAAALGAAGGGAGRAGLAVAFRAAAHAVGGHAAGKREAVCQLTTKDADWTGGARGVNSVVHCVTYPVAQITQPGSSHSSDPDPEPEPEPEPEPAPSEQSSPSYGVECPRQRLAFEVVPWEGI
ncbi:hypothetical protein N658DRAFT_293456 [Parathielavia hyrcaniae]|uniref:Uncharacterized protein n=1 Tax=Parathielavia hyrcaniae TaxID=113614 RepID=A0AAN6PSY3_9PEZI|nr:hypothetical protein N658DRAFT_293456 [Parathielavia hyrcaniae]